MEPTRTIRAGTPIRSIPFGQVLIVVWTVLMTTNCLGLQIRQTIGDQRQVSQQRFKVSEAGIEIIDSRLPARPDGETGIHGPGVSM